MTDFLPLKGIHVRRTSILFASVFPVSSRWAFFLIRTGNDGTPVFLFDVNMEVKKGTLAFRFRRTQGNEL